MEEAQDWCHFTKVLEMPYSPRISNLQATNLVSVNNSFGIIAIGQEKKLNLYYSKTLISSLKSSKPFNQIPFEEEIFYICLSKDCSQVAVGQKTQVSIVNLKKNSKFDLRLETQVQHLEFKGTKLGVLQENGKFDLHEFEKSLQKLKNVEFFTFANNSKNIFIVQEKFIKNYDLDSMKIVQQSPIYHNIVSIKQFSNQLFAYSYDESIVHILIFNSDLEQISDISDISLSSEGTDPTFLEDLKKVKIFFEFIENKQICVFTTSAHPSIEVFMIRIIPDIVNFEENYEGHGYLGDYEKGRFLKVFRGFGVVCCEHDVEIKEFQYMGEGFEFCKPPIAVCLDNLGGLTVFAVVDLRAEFLNEETCVPAQYGISVEEEKGGLFGETKSENRGNSDKFENFSEIVENKGHFEVSEPTAGNAFGVGSNFFTTPQPISSQTSNSGFFVKKEEKSVPLPASNSGFFVNTEQNKDKKAGSWMTSNPLKPTENQFLFNSEKKPENFPILENKDQKLSFFNPGSSKEPEDKDTKASGSFNFGSIKVGQGTVNQSFKLCEGEKETQNSRFFNPAQTQNLFQSCSLDPGSKLLNTDPIANPSSLSSNTNSGSTLYSTNILSTTFSNSALRSNPKSLFEDPTGPASSPGFPADQINMFKKPEGMTPNIGKGQENRYNKILESSTELFGKMRQTMEKMRELHEKTNFNLLVQKNSFIQSETLKAAKRTLEIYPRVFTVSQQSRDLTLLFTSLRKEINQNQDNNFNTILTRSLNKNTINIKNLKTLHVSLKETTNTLRTLSVCKSSEKLSLLSQRKQLISDKIEELRHKLLVLNYLARSAQPEAYNLWPEHNFCYTDPLEYKSLYQSLIKPHESVHFTHQSMKKSSQFTYKPMKLQMDFKDITSSSKPNAQKSLNNSLLQVINIKREKLFQEIESFRKSFESRKLAEASNKPVENANPLAPENNLNNKSPAKVVENTQGLKNDPKIQPVSTSKPPVIIENTANTLTFNAKPEPSPSPAQPSPFGSVNTNPVSNPVQNSFFVSSSNKPPINALSTPSTTSAPSSFFANNSAPNPAFPLQMPTKLANNPFENAGFGQKSSFVSPSIPKMEGIGSKSFGVSNNPLSGFMTTVTTPPPAAQPKAENSFFKLRK